MPRIAARYARLISMGVPRNRVLEIQRVDELNALTNLVQNDALLRTLSLHVHQQLLKQLASSTDL